MANKENAQDVQFEEVKETEQKQPVKKSFFGKVWGYCEIVGKAIWKERKVVGATVLTAIVVKAIDNAEKKVAVNKAWNNGCTTGRVSGKIEYNNSLTETEKKEWFQDNSLNRDAFFKDDKLGTMIIDGIKERRNK